MDDVADQCPVLELPGCLSRRNIAPILGKLTGCQPRSELAPESLCAVAKLSPGSAEARAYCDWRKDMADRSVAARGAAACRVREQSRPPQLFLVERIRCRGVAARHDGQISSAWRRGLHGQYRLCRPRSDLSAGGRPGLCRDGRGFVVRDGFPRPADGERRNLWRLLPDRGKPGTADPLLRSGDQSRKRPVGHGAGQRPRPLHVRSRRGSQPRDSDRARLRRCRHGPHQDRLCRARTARRRRQQDADGLVQYHDAGAGGAADHGG